MSSALKTALYARLTGAEGLTGIYLAAQTALAALLTTDINTGLALPNRAAADAVWYGNRDDSPGGVYPILTYRESGGGMVDRRFRGAAVNMPIYDLEIWDDSRSATRISDIDEQLQILLDKRRGVPDLPVASGLAYSVEVLMPLMTQYDDKLHAWSGLTRYKAVEARF